MCVQRVKRHAPPTPDGLLPTTCALCYWKKIDVQLQLLVDSRSLFLPVQPYTLSAACALQKLKLPLSAARTLQNTPLLIHTPHPARHTNPMTHLECRVCPEEAHRHTASCHDASSGQPTLPAVILGLGVVVVVVGGSSGSSNDHV